MKKSLLICRVGLMSATAIAQTFGSDAPPNAYAGRPEGQVSGDGASAPVIASA